MDHQVRGEQVFTLYDPSSWKQDREAELVLVYVSFVVLSLSRRVPLLVLSDATETGWATYISYPQLPISLCPKSRKVTQNLSRHFLLSKRQRNCNVQMILSFFVI